VKKRVINYLSGYSAELQEQARALKDDGRLSLVLAKRYPDTHQVNNNAALYAYVMDLKRTYLKQAPPLSKVRYNDKITTLHRALGTHTYATRQQGGKLKTKHELRVATLFRDLPPEFLRMIVVHELAHLRHKDHDKAFYRLCVHMEPDYHQYEFDLRLYLFNQQEEA